MKNKNSSCTHVTKTLALKCVYTILICMLFFPENIGERGCNPTGIYIIYCDTLGMYCTTYRHLFYS